jgi:hypothetical protein
MYITAVAVGQKATALFWCKGARRVLFQLILKYGAVVIVIKRSVSNLGTVGALLYLCAIS